MDQSNLEKVRASFRDFLPYWRFQNRETGDVFPLRLWPGQEKFIAVMEAARWIVDLKAGKQGHSELECAYDMWASYTGPQGNRVHIFSDGAEEAKEFLEIVKFGLLRLPHWFGVVLMTGEPGGETARSVRYRMGPDDVRTIVAYPARPGASINQSAWHVHCDELSKMQFGDIVLAGIQTTIADGGSLHVVSRGRSPDDAMAMEWERALGGQTYDEAHERALASVAAGNERTVVPLFVDYTGRPGRDAAWREAESLRLSPAALRHYAPLDPEDALSGDADSVFVEEPQWDQLGVVPMLQPGERVPAILSLDAGVKSDHFALTMVTRCPVHPDHTAIRYAYEFIPHPEVSFAEVREHLDRLYADYNIIVTVYDRYALDDMAQGYATSRYWEPFDQGARRLVADAAFRQRIIERGLCRIEHTGLRDAVTGAGTKLDKDEKKLRLVKRVASKKIDLAVSAAMCLHAAGDYNLLY